MDLSTRQGRRQQGARIGAAAEAAGLALTELATAIGCSRALIYQYVSGQVLAQADRLQAIARLVGRPLEWFYAEEAAAADSAAALPPAPIAADPRQRASDLRTLAEAQSGPPDFGAARATCTRLVEAVAALDDPQAVAEAQWRLGQACFALGDLEGTRAAVSGALEGFRALGLDRRERSARQTLGAALAGLGQRDKALAQFEAVIAGGDFDQEWRGRLGRADVYESLGRGEAALAELEAAERLIEAQPEGPKRSWAELYLGLATVNVYLLHDDFERAAAAARRCAPLAEELACVGQHLEACLNLGAARRQLLDWPGAAEAFDEAVRLARLTGDRERAAVAQACRADLWAAMGRLDEARAEAKAAIAEALSLGSARGELLGHLAASEACRRAGDANEALHHAQQAIAGAGAHELVKIEALGRLAAAAARRQLGETAAAGIEERRAAAIAERIGSRWTMAAAALAQARAALAEDQLDAAAAQLEVGQRLGREIKAGELVLRAEGLAAELAARRGQSEEAAGLAAGAIEGWLAVRDGLLAAEIEAAPWEDAERLTVLRRCLKLLVENGAAERAASLLEAIAWPPLTAEFAGRR